MIIHFVGNWGFQIVSAFLFLFALELCSFQAKSKKYKKKCIKTHNLNKYDPFYSNYFWLCYIFQTNIPDAYDESTQSFPLTHNHNQNTTFAEKNIYPQLPRDKELQTFKRGNDIITINIPNSSGAIPQSKKATPHTPLPNPPLLRSLNPRSPDP